ncbi:hypothetical protein [Pedobacter sp. SL55]|uniref:hypothetical protein n=1 Tax=Pedobacter sp. SL55 TaxID=2995161 RepID=UPI00226F9E58|nr:hypothetical protein [Pedobacter sp. SL55]WAC41897.1 hypothetical protein OVA16_05935 [Pedobacter sp. SL55]
MKKLILAILLAIPFVVNAQSDKILLHNGKTISGKVIKVTEHTVIYTYDGEDAEQTFGKFAVANITYGKSGREQEITPKVEVNGEADWEKAFIIENLEEVSGLKRVAEIKGKTSFINYRTAGGSDRKSLEKLKKEAAANKCPFVLMTSDKDIDRKSATGGGFGQVQSIKKGVSYSY